MNFVATDIHRRITLLALAFLLLELLDPTTPFVRVHATPVHQLSIGFGIATHHTGSPSVRARIPNPDRFTVAKYVVRQQALIIEKDPRLSESEAKIFTPQPRFLYIPLKLCPDDDLV